MPYFTKCCCYFKLETGGFILGSITIFSNMLSVASSSMELSELRSSEKMLDDEDIPPFNLVLRIWLIWTLTIASTMICCALLMFYGILYVSRKLFARMLPPNPLPNWNLLYGLMPISQSFLVQGTFV